MEIPYAGRAVIYDNFNELIITIPSKKNWFIILFMIFWLGGWAIGESTVGFSSFNDNSGPGDLFMIFWLGGWTVGGLFAIRTLIWMIFGKEVITVGQGALTIDKKWAIIYKAKTYNLQEAQNFRAQQENYGGYGFGNRRQNSPFNLDKTGTIKFDYGMQTVKFGDGLDEAEANYILQKLRDKKFIS